MKRRIFLALAASAVTGRGRAEHAAGGPRLHLPEDGAGAVREGGPREAPRRERRRRSRDVHAASARELKMAHDNYHADAIEPETDAHEGTDGGAPAEALGAPDAPDMGDVWRSGGKSDKSSAKAAKQQEEEEEEEEDPFHWNDDDGGDDGGDEAGDADWIHGGDVPEGANSSDEPGEHASMGKSGKAGGKDPRPDATDHASDSGKPNDNSPNGNGDGGHPPNDDEAGWSHASWSNGGHDVQAKLFKHPPGWHPKSSKSKGAKSKSSSWHGHWPRPPRPSRTPSAEGYPTYLPTPIEDRPPLTWLGVNGCTPDQPCDVCYGDCDNDDDCERGLECHHRTNDERVPGCAPGGDGDVPGADYCHDPGRRPRPSRAPSDGSRSPTSRPVPSSAGGALVWRGVNGCTPATPCGACEGDCDADADCASDDATAELACFKRGDGEGTEVPGCRGGGEGDIPGADYCYDVGFVARPTGGPTRAEDGREAHFIRSQAGGRGGSLAAERAGGIAGDRELQRGTIGETGWCISGALSPIHSQLLLEPCTPDAAAGGSDETQIVARMEQMDQLWHMDPHGHIRSIWDDDLCMLVPMGGVGGRNVEAPVEAGPCDAPDVLTEFYREERSSSRGPDALKLQGHEEWCVTFRGGGGGAAWKGAPVIVTECGSEDKFGWDFVREEDLGAAPAPAPEEEGLPRLRYQGRNACTAETPCDACTGDCDVDADCTGGLKCFQRERDDSTQVPGCSAGGPGDIAGADYCFDPDGTADDDAPRPTAPPAPAVPLRWLGAEGCTPAAPCDACSGDCDADDDCRGALTCFRRRAGRATAVPGCAPGGAGDVPGGDYCHDPMVARTPPPSPRPNARPARAPEEDGLPGVPKQGPVNSTKADGRPSLPRPPARPEVDGTEASALPEVDGTDAPTPSEPVDADELMSMPHSDELMSMPESEESEAPSATPTEEQTPPPSPSGTSGKPSSSPVAASAPLPAKEVWGKASKTSKSSKAKESWSSPWSSSEHFAVERERAHRVREGTTRTEREHAEMAAEDGGRTGKHGSTRWERKHADETD